MDHSLLPLLFLIAANCVVGLDGKSCLANRVPCEYGKFRRGRAGANEYSIHYVRITDNLCKVKQGGHSVSKIETLGTDNTRVLYSPGYDRGEMYDSRLLVEYNVQCGKDQMSFLNITDLDIQGKDCEDDEGNMICVDYILIQSESGEVELCGNTISNPTMDLPGNFTVIFRTNERVQGKGFRMHVICYSPHVQVDGTDCTTLVDFSQSVCENPGCADQDINGDTTRIRRQTDLQTPEKHTPSTMWPHKDTSKMRRQVDGDGERRNILMNEMVNYTDNTIIVFDGGHDIIAEFSDTFLLQTLDKDGPTKTFIGGVNMDINPHFSGPGLLTVLGRTAYFQKFVFSVSDREREMKEVFQALKYYYDCNPVLRARGRALLQFHEENMNGLDTEEMMKFNITCFYNGQLHCDVDDGFAPALPDKTTCQISDLSPQKCDPFYGSEPLNIPPSMVVNIVVRAVNCNGQRAESEVKVTP